MKGYLDTGGNMTLEDLRIPTEKQLKDMRADADKVVKRMVERNTRRLNRKKRKVPEGR